MATPQRKHDDDVTTAINPRRILRDGRRISVLSSATQAVLNA